MGISTAVASSSHSFAMRILIILGLAAVAIAEPPAPYAPSGWKPVQPFFLPTEQKPAQLQQQYAAPTQNYGPPKVDYGPPKVEYGPPKVEYGPPKTEYGPPTKQELPKLEQPKPWAEYGPPPSIQPSVSWEIPDQSPGQFLPNVEPNTNWGKSQSEYGPPKEEASTEKNDFDVGPSITEAQPSEVDETQRVLEQIRQYKLNVQSQQRAQQNRLKSNLRQSARYQTLPNNYDVPEKKQRFQQQRNNGQRFGRLENQDQAPVDQQGQDYEDGYEPNRGYEKLVPNQYGPPKGTTQRTTTEAPETTTPLPETTTELFESSEEPDVTPEVEDSEEVGGPTVAISNAVARLTQGEKQGQYYILQPNGMLQRVTYRTAQNPKNKNSPVVSNLRYENVNPIKDPIYSYANGQLVRINK